MPVGMDMHAAGALGLAGTAALMPVDTVAQQHYCVFTAAGFLPVPFGFLLALSLFGLSLPLAINTTPFAQ
jgi:hypothetical protein